MPTTDASLINLPCAHGGPVGAGILRAKPQDFIVDEIATFEFTDDGEHDYLLVEKTGENTDRVAGILARQAGVARRDVGFAGRKDRNAVTRQWFSVRRPNGLGTDWSVFSNANIRLVDVKRSRRKLKTGSLAGNRFYLRVRAVQAERRRIAARIEKVARFGVPNYFGPQRFGRDGNNLNNARRLFAGIRLRRNERSLALSAARALIFNRIVARRVEDGSWNTAIPGDIFNLDGSQSYFGPEPETEDLRQRIRCQDVHPSAVLWGRGETASTDLALAIEQAVVSENEELANGLAAAGVEFGRRAVRAPVHELDWQFGGDDLTMEFRLAKGVYATSVLREVVRT